MGYKRCLEVNDFEDCSLNKAKRLESNIELVSVTDNSFVKTVISGENEGGFYNIQWYDAVQTDTASEAPQSGDLNVPSSGHFGSWSIEDDTGSGATSLSSASSDSLEFNIPQKSYGPLDDVYSAPDCSPRKPVPMGPNHQAVVPVWSGKVNKISKLSIYNDDSPSSGLVSVHTAHDNEEELMGTPVLPMPDTSHYSLMSNKGGGGRSECNCTDQGSIRCVRQHVREARENMRKTLGMENFENLGFCDMGEDIALKWSDEEEEVFQEVVYSNSASLGRNFWKHLSAAFPSRTNKEIVSYFYNVFMLRRRAAQNRSRFLDIDSDDDECHHTRNPRFYGYENSEDDSGVDSLGDQDVHVENENYSDEDDGDDGNSDDGNEIDGYSIGNITEVEDGIDQRSSTCRPNSQTESWSDHIQHLDGTLGFLKDDLGTKDDSCTSFECDANMHVSYPSNGLVDTNSAIQAREFKGDQGPRDDGKLDMSSHEIENIYLLEPGYAKDWYPGFSTYLDKDTDFLPTSNLIEEFFGLGTPDRKTRSD